MIQDATCKGSWQIGTACGDCQRCLDEARTLIPKLLAEPKHDLVALLNAAPRPQPKPDASWVVDYMDWFFQKRGPAVQ